MWILPNSIASAFSAEPGASTWALSSDSALEAAESSLTWRGKPTPAKSWYRAWKKATWMQRLFGRMSLPSMDARFADWWTLSLAGSRVRTSPSPENAPGSPEHEAASGSSTFELSPRFSLDWSSLKTSRHSARAGSKSSSPTLPRSGTMRSGVLSERPMLAQHITGTASSFWPTITVTDASRGQQKREYKATATHHAGTTLTDAAVRLWPTPDASVSTGYSQSASSGASIRYSLAGKVTKQCPTTTAHDAKDTGAPTEFERNSPGLTATGLLHRTQTSGEPLSPRDRTLNPRFVEWLMGWPIGWTDCDSQVTEWFLLKPLSLSACSLNEHG